MLYFDRIDVSEVVDGDKTSASKEFERVQYLSLLVFLK